MDAVKHLRSWGSNLAADVLIKLKKAPVKKI